MATPTESKSAAPTADRASSATIVATCGCLHLRRASRVVTRMYDEFLARAGMAAPQYLLMVCIHADAAPTLPKLAKSLGLDRSTLTRRLQPLVRDQLVSLTFDPLSGTGTARVTEKGEQALARCLPYWREAQGKLEQSLGADVWRGLLTGLAAAASVRP